MINQTILQGRLVADPELRQTQSNVAVVSFRVAWSEKYKETETRCFLTCTAWRHTAEFIAKHFAKGQAIIVRGKLITDKYKDKDGNDRSAIKMDVADAHFCGPKADGGSNSPEPPALPHGATFTEVDDDGELPF